MAVSGELSPSPVRFSPMIKSFIVTHCASEEEDEETAGKTEQKGKSSTLTLSLPLSPPSLSLSPSDSGFNANSTYTGNKTLYRRVAPFIERHRVAINSLRR